MTTGFVILAAGAGTRMGGVAKCLITLGGMSLIERLLRQLDALGAQASERVIVLGHHEAAIRAHLAQLPQALSPRCVVNPQPEEDTASSLRVGLQALSPRVQQVAVLLADQPLIDADDLRQALRAYQQRPAGTRVQVPWVKGQPGHPVLFDARVRADLGDPAQPHPPSLRQWRAAHPKTVHLWTVDNPHYTHDLDTPEDLDALTSALTTAH